MDLTIIYLSLVTNSTKIYDTHCTIVTLSNHNLATRYRSRSKQWSLSLSLSLSFHHSIEKLPNVHVFENSTSANSNYYRIRIRKNISRGKLEMFNRIHTGC